MKALPNNPKGFSLLEMIAAMAAGMVVMVSIYTAYINHQRSHVTQQLVVEMQQNARAAMNLMKREIRMAGYDPVATDGVNNDGAGGVDDETSGAGMINSEEIFIQFSADISRNGVIDDDSHEEITYWLDGTTLKRQDKGIKGPQTIAYDIEAVAFAYAVDNEPLGDPDGEIDTTANGHIRWFFDSNGVDQLDQLLVNEADPLSDNGVIDIDDPEGGVNWGGALIALDRIRAVRIWLLARTRQPIKGHTDNRIYVVGPLHVGPGDAGWDPRRKRVLLTATVYCRNLKD